MRPLPPPTGPPAPSAWRAIWLIPDLSAPPCPTCGAPAGDYELVQGLLVRLAAALILKARRWDLDADVTGEGRVAVRVSTDGAYVRVRREVDEDPVPVGAPPGRA